MEPTTEEVLTTAEAPKTTESGKEADVKMIDETKENGEYGESGKKIVTEEENDAVDEKPGENGSDEESNENGHAEEPKENGTEEGQRENGAVEDEDKEGNKENGVDHDEPPVKKARKTPTKEERSPSKRRSSSRLVNQEAGKELPKEISSDNLENLKRKITVN